MILTPAKWVRQHRVKDLRRNLVTQLHRHEWGDDKLCECGVLCYTYLEWANHLAQETFE